MKRLAIITARGGSKRIPRKNIKDFLGKPIIAYSIETALKSDLFDEVMVSTEDEEIAEVAKKFGATIPFLRSKKNADDYSSTNDVLLEVAQQYQKTGKNFDFCCCIYPTAPLISIELLKRSFHFLLENNLNSTYPVVAFDSPIQRALKIDKEGNTSYFDSKYENVRSQDLETTYYDAGQFYWFNTEALLKGIPVWTENSKPVIISSLESQDIDTLEDWKLAELKYKYLNH